MSCEREHLSIILPCWQPQNMRPMKLRLCYHYICKTCKTERFRRKGEHELTSRRPTVRRQRTAPTPSTGIQITYYL
mgnify:CR=1 FL=1